MPVDQSVHAGRARPAVGDLLAPLELPRLHVTTRDYSRLAGLARRRLRSGHPVARFLVAELERATLCRAEEMTGDVVTMNARVLFRVGGEEEMEQGILAYPEQYHAAEPHISVLTPLGTALLGLREGDRMPFHDWDGRECSVVVTKVASRPEIRSGHAP